MYLDQPHYSLFQGTFSKIIWPRSMFVNEYLSFCHFYAKAIAKRGKARFNLHMSSLLFAAKHSWTTLIVREQTIICRQVIFASGHVVDSPPTKRRKICIE